jgi:hypothetical protein
MGARQSRRVQQRDALRQAVDMSLSEAPLPVGWEQSITSKGQAYFIDHVNKTTTFFDPRRRSSTQLVKSRPPKYKWDIHSKIQHLRGKLHQQQHDEGILEIAVRREHIFEDSAAYLANLDPLTLTRTLHIKYDGETGLDYGGMSRDWFLSLSEEMMSEKFELFVRKGNEYFINHHADSAQHIERFYFVGTIMGLAIYHGKLFHSYFNFPFYKSVLERDLTMDDLQLIDEQLYKSLKYIQENDTGIDDLCLTFSVVEELPDGTEREVDLKEKGRNIAVTKENKKEYLELCVQYYLHRGDKQINAIKSGLYEFVPLNLLTSLFDPEDLSIVIGGVEQIDFQDLRANVEYQGDYSEHTPVVQWFWKIVEGMSQDELKHLLHFVTGTFKVPVGGFAHLYGSNGPQKFTIMRTHKTGMPTAHSCFNRLELPEYYSIDELKKNLFYAITETQGFGLE